MRLLYSPDLDMSLEPLPLDELKRVAVDKAVHMQMQS